ncbi:trypsin-like [Macrobrachium nipponense]|uniref:trypsin-like n=1 Tax=Macrobrachium nipponense TaxID=159736 RepID=UPI0030C83031
MKLPIPVLSWMCFMTWGARITVGLVTPSAGTPGEADVPSETSSTSFTLDVQDRAAPFEGSQGQLDCGNHTLVPGQDVTILSENYPEKYPTNYYCKWHFQASSPESRITISCGDFDMENCTLSSLRIRGLGLSERYCNVQDNVTLMSANGFMKVVFKTSESSAARRGFNCTVSATNVVTVATKSNCRCGQVNRVARIVGGVPTEMHEYPWQVAITPVGLSRPFCGGSIISDRYVLTAAHCVAGGTPVNVRVTIGEHDWKKNSETPYTKSLMVDEIIVRPDYEPTTVDNDVALLKLSSPIEFPADNKIAPICLPPPDNLYENVKATGTGWGRLSFGGIQPSELREVTMSTMSNVICNMLYFGLVTDNMICAGHLFGLKSPCQGDSGGPLVTDGGSDTPYMVQIGIVSWGTICGLPGQPAVFARVNNYLDWIEENTADSTICPSPNQSSNDSLVQH